MRQAVTERPPRPRVRGYAPYWTLIGPEGERVDMVEGERGLWWFRHTETSWVFLPGQRQRICLRKLTPWVCPEVQPDTSLLPGPRARLQRRTHISGYGTRFKVAFLPVH